MMGRNFHRNKKKKKKIVDGVNPSKTKDTHPRRDGRAERRKESSILLLTAGKGRKAEENFAPLGVMRCTAFQGRGKKKKKLPFCNNRTEGVTIAPRMTAKGRAARQSGLGVIWTRGKQGNKEACRVRRPETKPVRPRARGKKGGFDDADPAGT